MHKQVLALSVVAALAAPAFADSSVTIYGRLDAGIEANDDGAIKRSAIQNFSSRLGFKGEESLGNGLSAVWQVESGIAPDNSDNSGAFASRNSFVGLKGEFGTLQLGHHDTPFKKLDKRVDLVWNQGDALEHVVHGKLSGLNAHTRQKNVVQYWSPKWDGFQLAASFSPDETKNTEVKEVKNGKEVITHAAHQNQQNMSFSAAYEAKNWNLGAAYDLKQDNSTTKDGKDQTAAKIVGGVSFGDITLGAAWSQLDNDNGKKTDTYMVNAAYTMKALTLAGSIATAKETASKAENGADFISLQARYAFSKRSTVYAYYSKIVNEAKGAAKFETGDNKYTPAAGKDPQVFGVALRHNF